MENNITHLNTKMKLNTLYAKSSKGKTKHWTISVEENNDGTYDIVTHHGYLDSKVKEDRKTITSGKNIGKVNETSIQEQAELEAQSAWNKKKDRQHYVESVDDISSFSIPLPMLAHPYNKRKHNITWPAIIQPKLDGCRCLAHMDGSGTITLYSRKGVKFEGLDHIIEELSDIMEPDTTIDGELYSHDLTFQEIMKRVRRTKNMNEKSVDIQYWVYDMLSNDVFADRYQGLAKLLEDSGSFIQLLEVETVNSEEEMLAGHASYVLCGYEGTMVRNTDGLYKQNHRSADLQKYKDFKDDEFEIIGTKTGVGKELGACIFICKTKEGKTFDVRPRGTFEERKKWYDNSDHFIGKNLTVRFQDYSDDRIPIFPVGIDVRDEWN